MKYQLHIFCFFVCLFVIFFSSCSKLYWYRLKIKAAKEPNKSTFTIVINNEAPQYLSKQFENGIKGICIHALNKKGFVESKKDTPDYLFVIFLKIDSFEKSTFVTYRNGYATSYRPTTTYPNPTYSSFSSYLKSKEISFDYNLINTKYHLHSWSNHSEFYFFGNELRDLRRSKSMINYALKHTPPN